MKPKCKSHSWTVGQKERKKENKKVQKKTRKEKRTGSGLKLAQGQQLAHFCFSCM